MGAGAPLITPCCYSGMEFFGISNYPLAITLGLDFLGSPKPRCCTPGFFWDLQYPLAVIPGFSGISKDPLLSLQDFLGSPITPCCYSRIFWDLQNPLAVSPAFFWISNTPLLLFHDGIFLGTLITSCSYSGMRFSWISDELEETFLSPSQVGKLRHGKTRNHGMF